MTYPADAIEVTFTLLFDMTDEPQEVDMTKASDTINELWEWVEAHGLEGWIVSEYVRNPEGRWRQMNYKRPPSLVRPKAPRRKAVAK